MCQEEIKFKVLKIEKEALLGPLVQIVLLFFPPVRQVKNYSGSVNRIKRI